MANLGYLQLTRNCYQKCQFCSNPPTGVHLDEAEMRRNIDRLVEMGYDGVILTGGEPSISELLFPALSYAREKKLFSRMITNGQKLAEKDFFKRCVDAGLTHIHVSLHSYRREVHDFITQYRGAWDLLVRCLENVPEMGVTSDINTVINVYNCDHLHENVQWICENFPYIRHLDFKGFIHQKEFLHGKGTACDACRFDPICAGMYSMAKTYDERELSPIFEDPTAVIAEVLGHEPSPELLSRLLARRGRRSM